jgi:hypothetical protein
MSRITANAGEIIFVIVFMFCFICIVIFREISGIEGLKKVSESNFLGAIRLHCFVV